MYKYKLWVKLNTFQTTDTIVFADNEKEAIKLGEMQYGPGSVMNCVKID